MQIVIQPQQGDRFLVDVADGALVEDVKARIQEQMGLEAALQHLSSAGTELVNGGSLSDYGVGSLDQLDLVVLSEPAEQDASTTSQMVLPEEIPCTVVVTGIPAAEQEATEDALVAAFSEFGGISRLILQTDAAGEQQHAVIVFGTAEAAAAAGAGFAGRELLGAAVTVVAAAALPEPAGGAGGEAMAGADAEGGNPGSARVAGLLASGMLVGQRGVARVKRFDEQHQIALKVKIGAEVAKMKARELDAAYGVSAKVGVAVDATRAKAKELDEKYAISEKATAAAQQAQQVAQDATARAMENPTVADSVKKVSGLFSAFKSSFNATVEQARAEVEAREGAAGPAAAGPPAAAPAGPPAAAAAPAPDVAADLPAPPQQ